jgi:hypothetical protein
MSWGRRCELRVLLIPLRRKVASSVNSTNGSNWRLICKQWQNSKRTALSSGCRFCTRCGWNGYKPPSRSVRHTRVRETPRRVDSVHVLVVGLRCTISRMFCYSSTYCWWNMSTGKRLTFMQRIEHLENTLRSGILRIGNRPRYSPTAAVAQLSQKP